MVLVQPVPQVLKTKMSGVQTLNIAAQPATCALAVAPAAQQLTWCAVWAAVALQLWHVHAGAGDTRVPGGLRCLSAH